MRERNVRHCSKVPAVLGVVAAVLAVLSCPASAGPIVDDVGTLVTIRVSNDQGTGQTSWFLTPGEAEGDRYGWLLPEPTAIYGDGQVLATIASLGVQIDVDPEVSLNFAVTAGASNSHFTITSAVVPFATITNPIAYASAAITVTDGDGDGATLTGLFDAGKAYEARYNDPAVVWAALVGPVTAAPDFSATGNDRWPATGRTQIVADLSSIASEYDFTLTANDSASGTSRFEVVVPEPATAGLLGLGVLGLLGRRKRQRH